MVKLYKLSSEQLSQQDHYDFGMRAVKSVLVMAGSLKRAQPELAEDAVLIRAMIDSNAPKFLNDDLPLFYAIVQVWVKYYYCFFCLLINSCSQLLPSLCNSRPPLPPPKKKNPLAEIVGNSV